MLDLTIHEEQLQKAVKQCRERKILIPTLAQQKNPHTLPEIIKNQLKYIGLWDVHPANLFRITWKNEPVEKVSRKSGPGQDSRAPGNAPGTGL